MTKQIHAGALAIGGGAPVSIQSMCNTRTSDADATVAQILALEDAGCELVRVTVPDMESAAALGKIAGQNIAEIPCGHSEVDLLSQPDVSGSEKLRISRVVINDLRREASPVDGVSAGEDHSGPA